MKSFPFYFILLVFLISSCKDYQENKSTVLFDGKTFNGFEGDTLETWRIEDGAIVGGSLNETVPNNDFLCTDRSFENFSLKLKIKLIGYDGFINSGVQFRSKRLKDPAYEMTGYQADWGEDYWASLYDESRRNMTLMEPDSLQVLQWIKINDWNDYEVLAENRRIRLYINGHQTVDYTELDESIPQSGLIGFQIHGGGKAQVAFKDITIEELE
jgi:3-keto-disaccharide hydrolase